MQGCILWTRVCLQVPACPALSCFEQVGVQPEVRRIGKYKSAGDQLLRADMSEAQREQLSALLDDIYGGFVRDVAASRGKTTQEVRWGWGCAVRRGPISMLLAGSSGGGGGGCSGGAAHPHGE